MAWHRKGDKPLSKPMTDLFTDAYIYAHTHTYTYIKRVKTHNIYYDEDFKYCHLYHYVRKKATP